MEVVPPPLPEVPRVPRLPLWRWIGFLLVAAIPVLAAADVFGDVEGAAGASVGPLEVEVRWPKRFRLQERGRVAVVVHNTGATPSEGVVVELPAEWVDQHEDVRFTPAAEAPWTFRLPPIPAGETARVVGEVVASRAGQHLGSIRVRTGDTVAELAVDTTVWP